MIKVSVWVDNAGHVVVDHLDFGYGDDTVEIPVSVYEKYCAARGELGKIERLIESFARDQERERFHQI